MKLEFLMEGAPECPLIRLYDFTSDEAIQLRQIFQALADGSMKTVKLEERDFIESMHGCLLGLQVGTHDLGIRADGLRSFECVLTKLGWKNVRGLTDSLCEPDARGYQWLTSHGPARLLLSRDGKWCPGQMRLTVSRDGRLLLYFKFSHARKLKSCRHSRSPRVDTGESRAGGASDALWSIHDLRISGKRRR